MIRRLASVTAILAALLAAPALSVLATPGAAYAVNEGCGTYAALVPPQPGDRVTMRPPMDNPYRATGTVVSVDDDTFLTVDRDVMEGVTTQHEYVRFCNTEEDALASEWGFWSAWPLAG